MGTNYSYGFNACFVYCFSHGGGICMSNELSTALQYNIIEVFNRTSVPVA